VNNGGVCIQYYVLKERWLEIWNQLIEVRYGDLFFQEGRLITFETVQIYHIVSTQLWWKVKVIRIVSNML
jgi:hypothetical protein